MMMMKFIPGIAAAALLMSCTVQRPADLIVYNAKVYTVDDHFSVTEAFAVKDGKIVETGRSKDITARYKSDEELNAEGKTVLPGLIDGHAHFYGYGEGLQSVNLAGTQSWQEIMEKVKTFAEQHTSGWIIGRGWDQNDWPVKEFPINETLNKVFPDRPVLLFRIDGHAAIANQVALNEAGIKPGQTIAGGNIGTEQGVLTGILVDNAISLVASKIPEPTTHQINEALLVAQKNCFAVGLTTVVDCGLDYPMVNVIDDLQKEGRLKMRLYVMLSDAERNYDFLFKHGVVKTDRLHVRSFKVFSDGALGSRGACLLQPYSDKPDQTGFLLSDRKHFEDIADRLARANFQMCTHAIGDSANREILNVYARVLKGKNDRRWRIEHAQVVHPDDFDIFREHNVIPSVQPTHATSDMYWAGDRLGTERLKSAYAYRNLLEQNNWLILGTDFPVENINPMLTFYAAVVRKDAKGYPAQGFQMKDALSREEALKGMTIWAAQGNFEEKEKGSLEPGKFADFIMLDRDIMTVPDDELLKTTVLETFINGEKVH